MANVVLCSELEPGARFLTGLAECAMKLQTEDHNVRLVCRDITTAHGLSAFKNLSIFQAPQPDCLIDCDSRPKKNRLKNYSSLLLRNGYHSVEVLTPLLRTWLHLLATLDADMVIADHAPTALLAGKLLMIPCAMIGNGFTVPPNTTPLPSFTPWKTSAANGIAQPDLVAHDTHLLAVTNHSIKQLEFDKVVLKHAKDIYSHAAQWVTSLAEIDHYGHRDVSYIAHVSDSSAVLTPVWPELQGSKIFVQLPADSPHIPHLFSQLKKRNDPVLAVIEGASDELLSRLNTSNIRVQAEPVNMHQAIEQCRFFINNSDHDLVYDLLVKGVPAVLLPASTDNTLLAYRVAKRQLGFAGSAQADRLDINKLLEKVDDSDQIWANASRLCLKYNDEAALARLQDVIEAELPLS